jgi:DNA-binding GntR family transcriptional regulator
VSIVAKVPVADRVYDAIKAMLASGRFQPGETISEVRLSNELEVSRTPVREAVRRLVGENLLQVTPQGLRIFTPSIEDLAEVYYTRAILEGSAGRLAAINAGPRLAIQLREILGRARPALATDDHEAFTRLNTQFHGAIDEASGNRRIQELLSSLDAIIVRYRRLSLVFPDHLRRSYDDHQQIVEQIEQGNPEAVETFVRNHIFRAGARIVRAMLRVSGEEAVLGSTAKALLTMEDDLEADRKSVAPAGHRKGSR